MLLAKAAKNTTLSNVDSELSEPESKRYKPFCTTNKQFAYCLFTFNFFFCFFRLMQQSRGSNSIVPNNSSEVSNNKGQPSSSDPTEVRVALINNADSDDSDSDAAGHTPRDIVTLV